MSFPDVTLATPHVGQVAYESNTVKIIKLDDDVENKNLRVFVQLGDNASCKYWVPVVSGDDYTVDWTNQNIVDAVNIFFEV